MAETRRDLVARLPTECRERIETRTREMVAEMSLHELRQARQLTQQAMAEMLGTSQASVSKLERRTDACVSTLRGYVRAMGGELEIMTGFPDGDVRVDQFGEVDEVPEAARSEES